MKVFWNKQTKRQKLRTTTLHLSQILQHPKSLFQLQWSSQKLSLPKTISYIYFLFIWFFHKPVTCWTICSQIHSSPFQTQSPQASMPKTRGSTGWREEEGNRHPGTFLHPLSFGLMFLALGPMDQVFALCTQLLLSTLAPRHPKSFPLLLSNPRVRVAQTFCYYLLSTPSQFDFPALPILWEEKVISGSSFKIGIITMVNQNFCED